MTTNSIIIHNIISAINCIINDKKIYLHVNEKRINDIEDPQLLNSHIAFFRIAMNDISLLKKVRNELSKIQLNEPITIWRRLPAYVDGDIQFGTFSTEDELKSIEFIQDYLTNFKRFIYEDNRRLNRMSFDVAPATLLVEKQDGSIVVVGNMDAYPSFIDKLD